MAGPANSDIYRRQYRIVIWMIVMIRIVGANTATLHHGRGIYGFPLEMMLQTPKNPRVCDGTAQSQMAEAVKIGTLTGPRRTSRVDQGFLQFSSVLKQFEQSIIQLAPVCALIFYGSS